MRWRERVRSAADAKWGDRPAEHGPLAVTMIYLFTAREIDVDNIPKPILDALTGFVYVDDQQVTDLVVRKRSASIAHLEREPEPDLVRYIGSGRSAVFISVANAETEEVLF
ncbi:MAG: RusA family crossover junction endodeoxyribonuclease [Rhodococcus sp.]|nr:RusA family crossover junction endodeoxyribonuclease [Rhodococcus sp. (in: high G+C Gram-positive bacteria)]